MKKKISVTAIVSFVLGILSWWFASVMVETALVTIPLVIAFGHIAISRIKSRPDTLKGKGWAIGGLAWGYGFIIVVILSFFLKAQDEKSIMYHLEQIVMELHRYANDNGGKFPDRLSALYPNYIPKIEIFFYPDFKREMITPENIDTYGCYGYVNGLTQSSEAGSLLAYVQSNHYFGTEDGRHELLVDGTVKWKSIDIKRIKRDDINLGKLIFPEAERMTEPGYKKPGVIQLRSSYRVLNSGDMDDMKLKNNLFDGIYNPTGDLINDYELKVINGDKVVIDHATELMWHQSGSSNVMRWQETKQWINNLNNGDYAGYSDWRFPTMEEAASLLEPSKMNGGLYIDPVFDKKQHTTFTGDLSGWGRNFFLVMGFHRDNSAFFYTPIDNFVRPVRTMK